MHYDVVALGDVNLDYIVRDPLSFSFDTLTSNGIMSWGDIDEVPGGSALNFCRHARNAGFTTFLLGKIGNDHAKELLEPMLERFGVAHSDCWSIQGSTGKAVILFDSSGVRLLVNNKANANYKLCIDDVDNCAEQISSCRLLYISGYCIGDKHVPRFGATLHAMEIAAGGRSPNGTRPTLVLDVVPHRLYETLSPSEFIQCTRHVDVLISEVTTIRRFLALGSKHEMVDAAVAEETARKFVATFPIKRFSFRFGQSGCDSEIIWCGEGDFELRRTDYSIGRERRGFGDMLAVAMLQRFGLL